MPHLSTSRSLNYSAFAIAMMMSQCAIGETIFSWRAADGSTTFSDRPPFDATDISVRTLSKPGSSLRVSEVIEEWHSDKTHPKTPAKGTRRDLSFACEPATPIQP